VRHSDADIEARSSPLGRIVAWCVISAFLGWAALIVCTAIYPPECVRVDVWQFSVCL
jgi:hypothetical protein